MVEPHLPWYYLRFRTISSVDFILSITLKNNELILRKKRLLFYTVPIELTIHSLAVLQFSKGGISFHYFFLVIWAI